MRTIIIEPYNQDWPKEFQRIKDFLLPKIKDLVIDIIHIGSTSVPNLSAKPIIDFIIIIESYDVFPDLLKRLALFGYEHDGDGGIKGRERMRRSYNDDFIDYHMYVCPQDSVEMLRQAAFRDYLRKYSNLADEYGKLKANLAAQFPHDIDSYIEGKHDFIESIIEKAKEEEMYGNIQLTFT